MGWFDSITGAVTGAVSSVTGAVSGVLGGAYSAGVSTREAVDTATAAAVTAGRTAAQAVDTATAAAVTAGRTAAQTAAAAVSAPFRGAYEAGVSTREAVDTAVYEARAAAADRAKVAAKARKSAGISANGDVPSDVPPPSEDGFWSTFLTFLTGGKVETEYLPGGKPGDIISPTTPPADLCPRGSIYEAPLWGQCDKGYWMEKLLGRDMCVCEAARPYVEKDVKEEAERTGIAGIGQVMEYLPMIIIAAIVISAIGLFKK